MRAVTVVEGDQVVVTERPTPAPGPGELLVRVHGAGLNRADLMQRAGRYPAPPGVPPDIPGLEFAGVVEAVADDVGDVHLGEAVFGIVGGGGQAEYLTISAAQCARVPDGLDLVAMGGVPEAFITAHDAMVTTARIAAGEWVLVHAVGSGVGTSALQLAKAFGARVVGTARTNEKLDRCRALGLDVGIVPPLKDDGTLDVDALAWQIVEQTGGGAHVTLDLVAGTYVEVDIAAAAPLGRIVVIGTLAGGSATLRVLPMMGKRLQISGTMLRSRSALEKAQATSAFASDVVPLLTSKQVSPVVEKIFPLDDAPAAYDLLATDATFGKLILQP
jgi:putative PIG3 family NAD(P)H quinone oxidoreductase